MGPAALLLTGSAARSAPQTAGYGILAAGSTTWQHHLPNTTSQLLQVAISRAATSAGPGWSRHNFLTCRLRSRLRLRSPAQVHRRSLQRPVGVAAVPLPAGADDTIHHKGRHDGIAMSTFSAEKMCNRNYVGCSRSVHAPRSYPKSLVCCI